jgi:ribonuclease HI
VSEVEIYTDGACRGNPGPGGWGALLVSGERRREIRGAEASTTNNRMELTAAIER